MGLTSTECAALSGAAGRDDAEGGIEWRPLYTIADATPIVGTRTRLYDELAAERLIAVRVGRRTMVTGASLRQWAESRPRVTFRGRTPRTTAPKAAA
ncbi:MAG: hypothetical protein ACREFZ_07275 [Acetobacteraceae bacterium]